ncbi:MAG: alpha-E domain-containing protein [Aphanocapsa lilacina HA4352-LM1]|jgi:uncharacterized alpha-E superfamily protein|nr:alpha-E domain-containing protein [Aphanocapsa lilacina HA4352-LM1]
MLSRIAEYHYWLGRYIERAENTARVVADYYQTLLDIGEQANHASQRWEMVLEVVGEMDAYQERYPAVQPAQVEQFVTFDRTNPSSILSCVTQARENARGIRDQISSELWLALNRLYLELRGARWEGDVDAEALGFYEKVKEQSGLIDSLIDSTILHDTGWRFLRLGRFFERALQTARILQVRYRLINPQSALAERPIEVQQWLSLLRSVSGSEIYSKLYRATVAPRSVAALLVLNPRFPRSLRFATSQVSNILGLLAASQPGSYTSEAERLSGRLANELVYSTLEEIERTGVVPYLLQKESELNLIGNHIHNYYFGYPVPTPMVQVQTLEFQTF